MGVAITNVILSKNTVNTGESFKIQVAVKETITEPSRFRLPVILGRKNGNLNKV